MQKRGISSQNQNINDRVELKVKRETQYHFFNEVFFDGYRVQNLPLTLSLHIQRLRMRGRGRGRARLREKDPRIEGTQKSLLFAHIHAFLSFPSFHGTIHHRSRKAAAAGRQACLFVYFVFVQSIKIRVPSIFSSPQFRDRTTTSPFRTPDGKYGIYPKKARTVA